MYRLRFPNRRESRGAIVVFHPGSCLIRQASAWAGKPLHFQVEFSFAQSPFDVRAAVRRAAVAVIDATENPAAAMAVFVHARAELPAGAVAVYSESVCGKMELIVCARGATLLLGPLADATWRGVLGMMLTSGARASLLGLTGRRRATIGARSSPVGLWKQRSITRNFAGLPRPRMRECK
ncbi:MAG TPA: hypothetical protein VMY42_03645 [Thermoguttaceae bacterium]|nr:hypothetical protein [Thermoguttaceae bacterium]